MEVITGSEGSSEKLLRKQPGGARWWSGRAWAEVEGCVGLVFRGVGVGVEVRGGEEEMGKGVPALAEAAAFLKAQRSPPPPPHVVSGAWCGGAGAVVLLRVQIQQWPWEWKEAGMLESSGGSMIARAWADLEWVGSKRERVGGGLGFDLGC